MGLVLSHKQEELGSFQRPLIHPVIPSSLTVMLMGSDACDLFFPPSNQSILGFSVNWP